MNQQLRDRPLFYVVRRTEPICIKYHISTRPTKHTPSKILSLRNRRPSTLVKQPSSEVVIELEASKINTQWEHQFSVMYAYEEEFVSRESVIVRIEHLRQ